MRQLPLVQYCLHHWESLYLINSHSWALTPETCPTIYPWPVSRKCYHRSLAVSSTMGIWGGGCQWRIQGGGGGLGGWNHPQEKSSLFLGVSLWFGDILSEKQCPICLRLHEKTFRNQKFPRGRAPRPLYIDMLGISHFGQWGVPNSLMAAISVQFGT